MRPRASMSAFIMLSILLASNMGCIGLVPAREFMEDLRDPPRKIDVVEKFNVEHIFVTEFGPTFQASISYSSVQTFTVDSEVTEISAYITASMPLEIILPGVPTDVRYVRATLTDANGEQVWIEEITETERKMVATFQQPLAEGTWTLNVESRGYGEEIGGLYKDSFQVIVKIDRECWEFPTEEGCSYD